MMSCKFPLAVRVIVAVMICGWLLFSQAVSKPDIYDPAAVVKDQIRAAQKVAAGENRHLLLMFGANWCPWCHRLHELMQSDAAIKSLLQKKFELIMIDVGEKANEPLNRDLMDLYRVKGFGLPVLVVLDKEGVLLCIQDTGILEKDKGHDPARVLAFLQANQPAG